MLYLIVTVTLLLRPLTTMFDLPQVNGADIASFPLDIFRVAIAVHLSKALNMSLTTAFSGVDLGKKGCDFTVATPKFRLKEKLSDLHAKIQSSVRLFTLILLSSTHQLFSSSLMTI